LDTAATQVNLSANFEMPWALARAWFISGANLGNQSRRGLLPVGRHAENLDFVFSDSKWQARLAQTDTVTGINASRFPLAFDNTIDVGLGFEYSPPQGLAYRAGYRYSQTPNSAATYIMLFPSVDQHWFTMGIGYKDGGISIDASLAYAIGVAAVITAAENPHSPGKYDSNAIVPAVTMQYNF
jgi:long-subunit fatty acid transport protein